MAERDYEWQRFWCPRGGRVQLSEQGYIWEPGAYNPDIVTFEQVVDVPCLALLGEPGIGKSRALGREFDALRATLQGTSDRAILLNLRSYGSEDRLVRALFEDAEFVEWVRGTHRLHLFLDSLDECLLRIDTIAAILADELGKYRVERLALRVTCRTTEYPNLLDESFVKLWGEENYKVYELVQLRREDVSAAAQIEGFDASEFLDEVDRKHAGSFAAKPVTLRLLFDLYRDRASLPASQAELYEEGCRILCEERNASRAAANLRGSLTADERMVVAGRIAAVTMFANRAAVWTKMDYAGATEEDVSVRELKGGTEAAEDGRSFDVTEEAIRETLSTGLFNLRGADRLGWAHQTYAEYLAAWYLRHRRLDADQVTQLLAHPNDPEGRLVPQLYETSAWAASLMPDLFDRLMGSDADVLLRSDVAAVDAVDRARLVGALLRLFEEDRIARDWQLQKYYPKLAHPGLSEQLRTYINDSSKNSLARRAAITIAHECGLSDLQDDLACLALDTAEVSWLRERAADALGDFGDSKTRAKLKPLALEDSAEDRNYELKGYALTAVWREHMTPEELFGALATPSESFYGSYRIFLAQHLIDRLETSDLPTALAWVENQEHVRTMPMSLREVSDDIMLRAWQEIDAPGVLEAFARAAVARLKQYDDVVEFQYNTSKLEPFVGDDAKRRRVIEACFALIDDEEKEWTLFIHSRVLRIAVADAGWLVEQLLAATSERARAILLELVKRFFEIKVAPEHLHALVEATQSDDNLRSQLASLFYMELDSSEAAQARSTYELHRRWDKRNEEEEEQKPLNPPPAERVRIHLERLEQGQFAAWWWMSEDLSLEPNDTHYRTHFEADITGFVGWRVADEGLRHRIILSAEGYVRGADPQTSEWFGGNELYYSSLAGYRALRLLLREAPDRLDTLDADIWRRWTPTVLTYPVSTGANDEKDAAHRALITRAYANAPYEVIERTVALIDKANSGEDGYFSIDRKFDDCWDERLLRALLAKAGDTTLKPHLVGQLLDKLLIHDAPGARSFAERLIATRTDADAPARERAVAAARQLMTHTPDAAWSVIWESMQHDAQFGREVSESLESIHRESTGRFYEKISEEQVADYYIWLACQYPHAEDPKFEGAHTVGPRENVATWRDDLLRFLKDRGTVAAVTAIERIAGELPHLDWLKYVLIDARQSTRRRTWSPLSPREIIALDGERPLPAAPGEHPSRVVAERREAATQRRAPSEWNGKPIGETPNLSDLLELYRTQPERLSLFVGAGLSRPLFPSWQGVLREMLDDCEGRGKLKYDKGELSKLIDEGKDYLAIADACARDMGTTDYREFICRMFDKDFRYDDVPPAYRELLILGVRTILTTNYDRIPDIGGRGEYRVFTNRQASEAMLARSANKKLVMKLHGDISDHESIVLTSSDYQKLVYSNESPLRSFLHGVFTQQTMLFMGFGFADPHIDKVLGVIKETHSGVVIPHYVLMEGVTEFHRNDLERKYGVRVIPYTASNASHPEVSQFVRLLSGVKDVMGTSSPINR